MLIPDAGAGCSLADSITADAAAGLEGRAPGRRRRRLREHERRGQGGGRRLLHLRERRRGGSVHPGGPRGAVPARPVPRRARPAGHRPRRTCTSGSASATCTRGSAPQAWRPGRGAARGGAVIHPECGCATPPRCGSRAPATCRSGASAVLSTGGMLDAARTTRPPGCWWRPRPGCCTSCARPTRGRRSTPVNPHATCQYMKMITPAALELSLETGMTEITVEPHVAERARSAVEGMIAIGTPSSDGE